MARKVKRKAAVKKGLKAKPPARKSKKRVAAKAVKKKIFPKKTGSAAAKRPAPAKPAKGKSPRKRSSAAIIREPAPQPVFIEQNAIPVQSLYEPVTPAADPVTTEINENQPNAAPENSENDEGTGQSKE